MLEPQIAHKIHKISSHNRFGLHGAHVTMVPLYSIKVEGAFSSFEVFISDARLKELIKVHPFVCFLYVGGHFKELAYTTKLLRDTVKFLYIITQVLLSIQLPPPSLKNATKFIETDSDILSVSNSGLHVCLFVPSSVCMYACACVYISKMYY